MAYATRADLYRLGIKQAALTNVSTDDQDAALEAASDVADSYLRSRYVLPLTSWGDDLKRAVCGIAAWDLLSTRGIAPNNNGNDATKDKSAAAVAWLKDVSAGRAAISGGNTIPGPARPPRVASGRPSVYSSNQQGWWPTRRR
jgi:phage gp36-like protein